jgi:hypothetical protein
VKRIRIFFEYLAAFIIIFLLLFAIASVVVIKYYGDEVKEYTMELVNEQVDTKIYVKEMGISVFRKFPYTSLFFKDVTVWSGHGFNRSDFTEVSPDTLFTAQNVFLQFNIIDLARRRYTIKNLETRNGVIRILTDSYGSGNYNISDNKQDTANPFLFDLKGVNIKNFHVNYINKAKALEANLLVDNLNFEGNISRINYQLKAYGNAHIHSVSNHDILYLSDQSFKTNVSLQVKENLFSISQGDIEIGALIADITGEFLLSEGAADLNLELAGKKVDVAWLSNILKKNGVSAVDKINGSGKIDLNAKISGLASSTLTPHIQTSFSTQGAAFDIDGFKYPIKSLDISGSFNNGIRNSGTTSKLDISSFHALVSDSDISGSLAIQNFQLPRFTLSLLGELQLEDLISLVPELPLNKVKGTLYPDIQVNGLITGLGNDKQGISFIPQGSLSLHDCGFILASENLKFDSINGTLELGNSRWLTSLRGTVGNSDFNTVASSSNLLDYFLNDEHLEIDASLHSSSACVDDLIKGQNREKENAATIEYPDNISVKLIFDFDHIKKGAVDAENVSGIAHYSFPTFFIDSIHAETMNGIIDGRAGLYDLNKDTHLATVSTNIEGVKIDELFASFDNFGQGFLTNRNIKGKISGNAEFSTPLSRDYKVESSQMILESSIRIENGELIDFEPMIEMSKFLKIDKMDHIIFSTIENTVMIRDNSITIPEMEIQSTALNLSASGSHSFDKTYNYHLAIKLSELLFKKAQSSANREFEVALDEQDKRTIFLMLYDEGDGIIIEFDEKEAIKKIREDMKDQRNELKVAMNKEFGAFEDDTAVIESRKQEESPMFKFEFMDEEPSDTLKIEEKEKTKWWKKKENKKERNFVIEDDLIP